MKGLYFFLAILLPTIQILVNSPLHSSSISGKIRYEGRIPKFAPLDMSGDAECMLHHSKKNVFPEVLVLGEGNSMANVIVHVLNPPQSEYSTPSTSLTLDQDGCIYKPHVLCIRKNQSLEILNPDETLHNVHAMPEINKEFNMAMPKFRKRAIKRFQKTETKPFPIKCDVHPWMTAWIAVFDHPYYQVTQQDGQFLIKDLPNGHYKVEAWHEKLGSRILEVDVKDQQASPIEFVFKR